MAAAVPDFFNLANQQAQASNDAAWQTTSTSRPNQNSYFGSQYWNYDNGRWTQTTQLSPEYQAYNNALIGANTDRANAASQFSSALSPVSLDGLAAMPENSQGAVQQVIDAMRGLQSPALQRARESENARLAAMGITMGSDAYNDTQRNLANQESDADLKAILAGTQEYGNVFNRQLALRNQGLDEQIKSNASNVASLGGLTSGLSFFKPEFSNFSTGAATVAPNIYGAGQDAWAAATGNMNAMNASHANNTAGNMGIASSVLGNLGGITSGLGNIWSGISGLFGGGYSNDLDDLISSNNGWADVPV